MKTPKQTEEEKRVIYGKEKVLLKFLHSEIHNLTPENDPFDDKSLLRKEITRYLFLNGNKPKIDSHIKGRYAMKVSTEMFGGKYKHVDIHEWRKLEKKYS